ncbi:hypothetical protein MN116_007132 [Schistosoma mekongi]|uniref:Protein arginine methyltransferase NDUFAF7 n=1 Tax=Schistosoma mekongi TaxID=38744 RepID=A0AAE1Z8J5_SCHME|nr:hypothetical protein MN116_007132 [Schistosoma mekongi]
MLQLFKFCGITRILYPPMYCGRYFSLHKSPENLPEVLKKQLTERINTFGPLTIAEYMKECLSNPLYGYYNTHDVFGISGDFTTSPEICQVFGELIGVWLLEEWKRQNHPEHLQLVEFGPGRGTLCADILRVFSKFPDAYSTLSIHLVEINHSMQQTQKQTMHKALSSHSNNRPPPIFWHTDLRQVPEKFSFFIGHEFFDVLPVHCFRKHEGQWHEVLVGSMQDSNDLCFVRSSTKTPASIAYLPLVPNLSEREAVEICPDMICLTQLLSKRIYEMGGAALLIDYGHEGEKGDTFRGFYKHTVCDPLLNPGHVDLTCDVDFSILCQAVKNSGVKVRLHGPVSQAYFLINMGLFTRLKVLLSKCESEQQKDELFSACEMLVTDEQMGSRFKFVAITPELESDSSGSDQQLPGFTPLSGTPYAQSDSV